MLCEPDFLRDALEEGDGVPGRRAHRAHDAVRGGLGKVLRHGLKALADVHDERVGDWGRVDPVASKVLNLQAWMRRRLEQERKEPSVEMGPDPLIGGHC